MKRVVIIGSGNLAEALARAVAKSDLELVQIFARNPERARVVAELAAVSAISGFSTSKSSPAPRTMRSPTAYMWLAKLQAKTAARCTLQRCAEEAQMTVPESFRANASSSGRSSGNGASRNTGITEKSASRPFVKVCIG